MKNIPTVYAVFLLLLLASTACHMVKDKQQAGTDDSGGEFIVPGGIWKDTDGNVINAHGGGILYHKGVYYWYGEFKGDSTYRLDWVTSWECWRADAGGVSCYSSRDLAKWKFEGLVLPCTPEDTASELHPSQVIERPKVIYNEKTRKFVMWMHIESPDYEKAHAGVAVCNTPTGQFTYLGSFKPNGMDSRDQTIFKDGDGRAYQVCSSDWNRTMVVSLLTDDYTQPSGVFTRNFINRSREAPAVFRHQGRYYMITSGCTGWDPNAAEYAVADSMLGEWTACGNPCAGKDADSTFHAQSTFVFNAGGGEDHFIAMFDRWKKRNLIDSRYVWLPLIFESGRPVIRWQDSFNINPFNINLACTEQIVQSGNYYFDPKNGDDRNTGSSPDQAFKSLAMIRELSFGPGDSILLKSGTVFHDQLFASCQGAPDRPIVIGKYGGEAKPHIKGDGLLMQAVHILNSEYIELRDLEVSNKGERPVAGLKGVLVELRNYGTARETTIDDLYIHDVLGTLKKEKNKGGTALMLRNYRDGGKDSISSCFDGLTVQNCLIRDCQRNGIIMAGNWIRAAWNPSHGVVIRNNILEGVPGDGIVPVACQGPLVEYNVMRNCPAVLPATEACDGIWPWSCDDAVIQYNIVSDHHSQVDGYAYDSDWNSNNSLFQYNLSFNNDGGFLLVCNSGGWPEDWSTGNKGTIVRYNISINDGIRDYIVEDREDYYSPVIHMTGPTLNTRIEKNLIYVFKKKKAAIDRTILSMTDWRGYPDSTFFNDNYIYVAEKNVAVDPQRSTNNFFEGNLYLGDLQAPGRGFSKYSGNFESSMWYDGHDPHWNKLLDFVRDKKIEINGRQIPVPDVIGYKEVVLNDPE